jgi:hypothetical protein
LTWQFSNEWFLGVKDSTLRLYIFEAYIIRCYPSRFGIDHPRRAQVFWPKEISARQQARPGAVWAAARQDTEREWTASDVGDEGRAFRTRQAFGPGSVVDRACMAVADQDSGGGGRHVAARNGAGRAVDAMRYQIRPGSRASVYWLRLPKETP